MNLRTLASVSTGFAVISGIVSAYLWHELHSERKLTIALQTQLAGSTGQPRTALPDPGIDARIVMPPPNTGAPLAAVAPQPADAAAIIQNTDSSEQELLKDPGYRRAQFQASAFAATLAQAGAPLDGAQVRIIAKALFDEQESLQQDIVALARGVDLTNPQTQARAQDALKKRRDESNQRILNAVSSRLTAQQLSIFRVQIEQQETRRSTASGATGK